MGLSSSQGRLLLLTSRLSDLQLQEMMVAQNQSRLAYQSEKAAQTYSAAMNNYKLMIKVTNADSEGGYKQENLTYDNMTQMGYLATNANGDVYLKKLSGEEIIAALQQRLASATTDEEKATIQAEIDAKQAEINTATANGEEYYEWDIPKDMNGNPLLTINEDGTATITGTTETCNILDGSEYLGNSKVMQNLLMNGMMFIINTNNGEDGITMNSLESDTEMLWVLDTSDDAKAESEYQYETASIARKDNQLDLELQQLETQHNAVVKEIESVKKVIENNVDRTFKLFSKG